MTGTSKGGNGPSGPRRAGGTPKSRAGAIPGQAAGVAAPGGTAGREAEVRLHPPPVFIGATRSFWFGILPAILVAVDVLSTLIAQPESALPLARLLAALTGLETGVAEQVLLRLSPLFALVVAGQRSGAARPYSLRPVPFHPPEPRTRRTGAARGKSGAEPEDPPAA